MAGDWIKMRGNLWDDPRVARICDATEQPEAMIVGALYWLWAMADQHTEDGILPGLTLRAIDRKTGVQGFAQALCDIGWLSSSPEGVRIIGFEEHNGASAKKRCQTAKRVAAFKAGNAPEPEESAEGNADSVTEALAVRDLEKRREEKKEDQCTHTPLAQGWKLPKPWGEWALAEFPHWTAEVVRSIADQFADHWRASAGSSADWQATWQKWCRDDLTQRAHPKPREAAQPRASPTVVVGPLRDATQAEFQRQAEQAAKLADPEEQARIAAVVEASRQRRKGLQAA